MATLAGDADFGPAAVATNAAGDVTLIEATVSGDPQSETARQAIQRLRDKYVPGAFGDAPAAVFVTGATAIGIDDTDLIADYTSR